MKEMLGENSEYGLICENNEEALYKTLKNFLKNKKQFDHYKKVVQKRTEIFDIKTSIKNIEKLFEEQTN